MVRIPKLKQISDAFNLTTYEAGLLQLRAYRNLKNFMTAELVASNLTLAEWALLGQVFQNQDGLRLTDLSVILNVEAPLATNLVKSLKKKGLVERLPDQYDSRAKLVRLTADGRSLVPRLERRLRSVMRHYLAEVPIGDLAAYLRVLRLIADKTN